MKITEVRAKRIKGNNRLKGIAAITIDKCFVIHELRIIDGKNGLFVAMPSRRMPNGEYKDVAHPINTETRSMIEKEVLETFEALPELEDDELSEEYEANIITLSGDSLPIPIDYAKNADILLHECTFFDQKDRRIRNHTSIEELEELIIKSNPKKVIIYHVSSRYNRQINKMEQDLKRKFEHINIHIIHPEKIMKI